MANRLKQAWSRGETVVGGWLQIPSGYAAEVMCKAGYDSLTVDMQHGVQDYQSLVACFQAMTPHRSRSARTGALERAGHHRQGSRRGRDGHHLPHGQHAR